MRLAGLEADGTENDVDGNQVKDEECLASRRDDAQSKNRHSVVFAKGRGVDEVGIDFTDEPCRQWEESQK
jgi:hypothetical protein